MAAIIESAPSGAALSQPRPGRGGTLRYTTRPPLRDQQFKLMKPIGDVHEVVIAIHEADATTFHRMPSPPKAPTAPSQDPTAPSLRLQAPTPPLAHGPITPISLTVPCPSPPPPSQGPPASPTSRESSPRSHTSSPTLVRKGSTVSTGTYSPIMRSMFPRYNPTVPLAQQRYYPQIHINPTAAKTAAEAADSGSYSPSLYAQQEPSRNGQKTPLPKGLGLFDAGKLAEESRDLLDLSTPDELVDLWALANGQTSQKATKEYGLELSCDDLDAGQGIICFGSSTSRSLYSLSAIDDELSISRSHPINDTTTIQVSAPTLQNPSSTSPLIATVFPKLAELMAIDKSSSVAVEHKLDRKESAALQTEALERAYRKEASTLLWDSESQKYYLIHPTLLEDDSPAAIPIQVSSAVGTPRELKIFAPDRTDKPLLELSFETLHLNIHTEAITSYSSLHLLDTLLSTTLVLLLHLHRSRPSPSLRPSSPATSAIPVFDPPPLHPKTTNKKERRLTSWSKSFFTRSTAEEKRQQVDDGESATAVTIRGSPSSSCEPSMTAKLPHPPRSTFQIFDPGDEGLPRTMRAALTILYWGFECLIWALRVLVNVLAMVLVGWGKVFKVL